MLVTDGWQRDAARVIETTHYLSKKAYFDILYKEPTRCNFGSIIY